MLKILFCTAIALPLILAGAAAQERRTFATFEGPAGWELSLEGTWTGSKIDARCIAAVVLPEGRLAAELSVGDGDDPEIYRRLKASFSNVAPTRLAWRLRNRDDGSSDPLFFMDYGLYGSTVTEDKILTSPLRSSYKFVDVIAYQWRERLPETPPAAGESDREALIRNEVSGFKMASQPKIDGELIVEVEIGDLERAVEALEAACLPSLLN